MHSGVILSGDLWLLLHMILWWDIVLLGLSMLLDDIVLEIKLVGAHTFASSVLLVITLVLVGRILVSHVVGGNRNLLYLLHVDFVLVQQLATHFLDAFLALHVGDSLVLMERFLFAHSTII